MQENPLSEALLKSLLGRRVKQLREQHEWTQQKLAIEIGLESDRQIRKWERGERFPELKNLIALAQVFNVEFNDLFDFSKLPKE